MVIGQRQRIVEETDAKDKDTLDGDSDNDDNAGNAALDLTGPSKEALEKFTDYRESR